MASMNIEFIILDSWLSDPIDRGYRPPMLYMIYEMNNKVYVKWEKVNDTN